VPLPFRLHCGRGRGGGKREVVVVVVEEEQGARGKETGEGERGWGGEGGRKGGREGEGKRVCREVLYKMALNHQPHG
jgi:hypothetical protein